MKSENQTQLDNDQAAFDDSLRPDATLPLTTGIINELGAAFVRIWQGGRYQLIPFVVTIGAFLLTDLLIGAVAGLVFAIGFILNSNLRRPLRQVLEKHAGGDVLHIELAEQVSFLNRPAMSPHAMPLPKTWPAEMLSTPFGISSR